VRRLSSTEYNRSRRETREYLSKLKVKLCNPNASVPKRGTQYSAGYDLYCCEPITIKPGSVEKVDTGLKLSIPEGCYGRIASRSSWALDKIFAEGGVIDRDYTGIIKVLLYNASNEDFDVRIGDRCAQIILEKVYCPEVETVKDITDEFCTRKGGFGSTDDDDKLHNTCFDK
jgi:dUTP pyrophosphatase